MGINENSTEIISMIEIKLLEEQYQEILFSQFRKYAQFALSYLENQDQNSLILAINEGKIMCKVLENYINQNNVREMISEKNEKLLRLPKTVEKLFDTLLILENTEEGSIKEQEAIMNIKDSLDFLTECLSDIILDNQKNGFNTLKFSSKFLDIGLLQKLQDLFELNNGAINKQLRLLPKMEL